MHEHLDNITNYLDTVQKTLQAMDKQKIHEFIDLLLETHKNEGTIFLFGNGGSGATASHFCGDFIKGVSYGLEKRFKVLCLNDNVPGMAAIANDISYDAVFVEQLKNFAKPNDLVIGISGSGNSANVVQALEYANSIGAKTVALCGFKGGKIKDIANTYVHAEIDDMEIVEDLHMVLTHCVKRVIMQSLGQCQDKMGEKYQARLE